MELSVYCINVNLRLFDVEKNVLVVFQALESSLIYGLKHQLATGNSAFSVSLAAAFSFFSQDYCYFCIFYR